MPDDETMEQRILRKLLTDPNNGDQHYVDVEMGVFDVRVNDFTSDEVAFLKDRYKELNREW